MKTEGGTAFGEGEERKKKGREEWSMKEVKCCEKMGMENMTAKSQKKT